MEQQGQGVMIGIPKLFANQRDQYDNIPPESLDEHGIKLGLFEFPRPLSEESPDQTGARNTSNAEGE